MRYRNALLFLVLSTVWGSAFVAIKAGLAFFPPVLFAALRYDIAGVLMLGYAWYATDTPIPEGRTQWASVLASGALMIAAYHAFLFVGENDPAVTSASAAVVVSLSPVLTTAFARGLLPDERLTPVGIAGMLLGLVGVGILTKPTPSALFDVNPGLLLVFAAAASFALGSVINQRLDAEIPIETMEAWAMLSGAALMHVVSLGLSEPQSFQVTTQALLALGYLSLAASAAGFLIYFDLLDRLGPIEINLVSYVAPVFAALSGFVFLGEVLDVYTVVGFVIIVTGFALLKRRAIREELFGAESPPVHAD